VEEEREYHYKIDSLVADEQGQGGAEKDGAIQTGVEGAKTANEAVNRGTDIVVEVAAEGASITVQFGLCLPLYWNQAGCRSKKHQKYCLHNGIKQTVDPKTTTSQARRESLTSNSAWMNASTNPTHRVSHKPHLSMDAREADASSSGAAI